MATRATPRSPAPPAELRRVSPDTGFVGVWGARLSRRRSSATTAPRSSTCQPICVCSPEGRPLDAKTERRRGQRPGGGAGGLLSLAARPPVLRGQLDDLHEVAVGIGDGPEPGPGVPVLQR